MKKNRFGWSDVVIIGHAGRADRVPLLFRWTGKLSGNPLANEMGRSVEGEGRCTQTQKEKISGHTKEKERKKKKKKKKIPVKNSIVDNK